MRVAVAVVALGGLLVWEAWSERARHRIMLLLERLPVLLVQITADLTAWQLAMVKAAESLAEVARDLRLSQHSMGNAVDVVTPRMREIWVHGYTVEGRTNYTHMILGAGAEWTQAPDDSWIDSYSGRGEELERLEQVIEEQRMRIERIR